ncbi:cytochrome P450 [Dichomitus squalens LYAD-421 SS1]|uniref:Cytochrome P450 n=1 Tax=Dichomitus squalens (strain LYAD-421) TaxID=732165 RepID=R7SPH2_DICSQ|nr:cytochrome P450 [Dichomitus squalens LYAD-421 SS1]EJF56877.1 cytochrome P450 [Dichomitus squalens LYAD-421 SS1]
MIMLMNTVVVCLLLALIARAFYIWVKLAELSKAYGPIYSLRLLNTPIVVINSAEVERELLDVKSALYANRPLPSSSLQASKISEYRDVQDYHINTFLSNLLQHPKDFFHHIRHLSAGVTVEISHGYRVMSRNDEYVKEADVSVVNFADAALPNNYIVDWFPSLAALPAWLPGMGFKRKAAEYRKQYYALAEEGHRMVKAEIAKGTARPSLTYTALAESSPGQYPDDIIMFTTTQVYTGGGDTSSSLLASFFLALLRKPEVVKRGHEEIDRIVGDERLPTFDDRANLPYIQAIVAEVARVRPPISFLPRLAGQDDVYRGHHIEKDSYVLVNYWGMMHDETLYPDPDAFKPERWLSMERNPKTYSLDVIFGSGRRVLAMFDISPALDDNGKPIIPLEECTDGGITIKRSSHVAELLPGDQG